MASVIFRQLGGDKKLVEASSVRELKDKLGLTNHSVTVNEGPADDSYQLSEGDVVFADQNKKGG